jgi:hypothetical protein
LKITKYVYRAIPCSSTPYNKDADMSLIADSYVSEQIGPIINECARPKLPITNARKYKLAASHLYPVLY